jgi:hypothetical protein
MKGVEIENHVIVVLDVVPVGYCGPNRRGAAVMGNNREVDCIRRIPDQDVGLLLGRSAIYRLVLPESGKPGGARPHRLVQPSVDLDLALQPWDVGNGRALALDHSTQLGTGCLKEQQQREHDPLG